MMIHAHIWLDHMPNANAPYNIGTDVAHLFDGGATLLRRSSTAEGNFASSARRRTCKTCSDPRLLPAPISCGAHPC